MIFVTAGAKFIVEYNVFQWQEWNITEIDLITSHSGYSMCFAQKVVGVGYKLFSWQKPGKHCAHSSLHIIFIFWIQWIFLGYVSIKLFNKRMFSSSAFPPSPTKSIITIWWRKILFLEKFISLQDTHGMSYIILLFTKVNGVLLMVYIFKLFCI